MSHKKQIMVELFLIIIVITQFMVCNKAHAGNSAVIFMYHRFGEEKYPSTSIKLEQFEAHLKELKNGNYRVMALPKIIKALKNGENLPDKTIALTIDDAYLSVYREAWPRLKKIGFPFTIFVATDPVDDRVKGYMSWSQLRELHRDGVTIGSQTASHLHMADASYNDNKRELEKSNARFMKELGERPELIAYPYGETSLEVEKLARKMGFIAGFGQHSGVAAKTPNVYYLPRFALNENYGDMVRFSLAANALALNTSDLNPEDPVIGSNDNNPPAFGFTINSKTDPIEDLNKLACYSSHEGKLNVTLLGANNASTRVEVRMQNALPKGRTRINCTLPAGQDRWFWFGHQFYKKG